VGLRARIWIVVAAGAALAAIGVALLLGNTIRLRASSDATIRSSAYLASVTKVEDLVVDAETGLRGYIITGRPLFLAPLRTAQAQLPGAIRSLERNAAGNDAFVAQARALGTAADAYLVGYVPHVLGMHDLHTARSLATTLQGKHLVDGVRARTGTLARLVSARDDVRQHEAHARANRSVSEAIIVLVLLTALTLLVGVVLGRLVIARERARARSERTARTLQESLLPGELPPIPGCEVAAQFTPGTAGDLVGGDFYDVFELGPRRWALVLGDVCGKGPEAAALTAMARWTLRSLATQVIDTPDVLRLLNDALVRQNLNGRFITTAYIVLTVEDERAHVLVACAGHPAPILIPAHGRPVEVAATGTLLGTWHDISLHTAELALGPGDGLVVYSDGVTEQGPALLPPSLIELLGDRAATSAAEVASRLERHGRHLAHPQRDDITVMALRFTGDVRDGARPGGPGEPAQEPAGCATSAESSPPPQSTGPAERGSPAGISSAGPRASTPTRRGSARGRRGSCAARIAGP
jgi:serine phosphatase RsbU (regulator of sigma subunit)